MAKSKNTSYVKGRRWGFAVARAELRAGTGKAGVHKVDKAMATCAQNARTGTKRLTQDERNAYRGISHGMYDALRASERKQNHKQKKHDFDYDSRGRIKGGYTVDGKFEPD